MKHYRNSLKLLLLFFCIHNVFNGRIKAPGAIIILYWTKFTYSYIYRITFSVFSAYYLLINFVMHLKTFSVQMAKIPLNSRFLLKKIKLEVIPNNINLFNY